MGKALHPQPPATRDGIGRVRASLLLAAYLLLLTNFSLWKVLWSSVQPAQVSDVLLLGAIGVMLLAFLWMLMVLLAWGRASRPLWSVVMLLAAVAAYFMDSYGLMIDRIAIQSVFESDPREISEWISLRMLPYALLAAVPIIWIWRIKLLPQRWLVGLLSKAAVVAIAVTVIGTGVFLTFQPLASLARNQRQLVHLINPSAVIQSTYGFLKRAVAPTSAQRTQISPDAHAGPSWATSGRKRLLVLVIGESARAGSFSLLGYGRDTNPRLAAEGTLNFANVHSCGTSTAVSLPCMFSDLGEKEYTQGRARARETLLDVLALAGVDSLWLDNNTGSKGIAARTGEQSIADDTDVHWCGATGCYDELLLERLRQQIDSGDVPDVVVLHQKGSHGPSYFERYPPKFRHFTPTCDGAELGDCSPQEILNTYDNSILYTDHFLAETIDLLRARSDNIDSAMLYVSDHGESTGENGMFLHGAPAFMAPREQTWVPMILWLSQGFESRFGIDRSCLSSQVNTVLSHDNLFHSVLGLMDVQTRDHRDDLDVFAGCRVRAVDSTGP